MALLRNEIKIRIIGFRAEFLEEHPNQKNEFYFYNTIAVLHPLNRDFSVVKSLMWLLRSGFDMTQKL